MRILCSISTKNRYDNYLPLVIMSVINQTRKPDHLTIYDDNSPDKRIDIRTMQIYQHVLQLLDINKIGWDVKFGQGKGVAHNHQMANKAGFDWVWRLDDDNFAEPNVLEELSKHMIDGVGAVGGSILTVPLIADTDTKSSSIDNLYAPNKQWFKIDKVESVDHLNCSFVYRAGIVDYNLNLSPKSFREETMLTYGLKLKGYDILIIPNCVTYDFHAKGGIR